MRFVRIQSHNQWGKDLTVRSQVGPGIIAGEFAFVWAIYWTIFYLRLVVRKDFLALISQILLYGAMLQWQKWKLLVLPPTALQPMSLRVQMSYVLKSRNRIKYSLCTILYESYTDSPQYGLIILVTHIQWTIVSIPFWYWISHRPRMQRLIVTIFRRTSGLFHSMNVKSTHHLTLKTIITNMIFSSIHIGKFWHIFKCNTSLNKNLFKHCHRLCYKTNATS